MDAQPEITDVRRLHLEPGDALVVHADARQVSDETAQVIKGRLRAILKLPADVPIVVLGSGTDIEVVSSGSGQPG